MVDCFEVIKENVRALINDETQSVAHRMDHMQRVTANALEIASHYPDADLELLRLAALLHDVCQPFDRKDEHVDLSVKAARKILEEVCYPPDRAEKVLRIISEHSTENMDRRPTTIEAKILFDADKLDGLGASGIARVFALFGQKGKTPLEAVPWYLHKMEMARENMQTEKGRRMAKERARYVIEFLEKIKEENRININV
ncbi:MAG TPA: HD domain-containing protein [Methanotrichaceae archaeon]|nr:HD domain-containing protein [Methanotrichaceae archaeon]